MPLFAQLRVAQNPLLILAAAISTGIVLGGRITSHARSGLTVSAIVVAGLAALSIRLVRRVPAVTPLLIVVGFIFTGLALSLVESRRVAPDRISYLYEHGMLSAGDPVELTGTIEGQPEPAPQSFYLILKVENIRLNGLERDVAGTILLLAQMRDLQSAHDYEERELRHGARIRLLVTLDREDNFRNPGVMPFTEYLEREGFDATGVIKSPLLVERLDDAQVFLPLALLYQWRELLQRRIYALFSPETAGVLDAALLGNHYNISLSAAERFRAGGTFHVLVISGLQIVFIGGLVLLVVRWFTKRRVLQVTFATTFLWAYTVAVGADSSVARSAFMFTIVLVAPLVSRRANTLNSLGAAAITLLVWRPDSLFDPSFQLTFLSVLSIVSIAVPLITRLQQVGSWRPTHETPYPPDVSSSFRMVSEVLFWSEREWKREMAGSNIRYRLFKTEWSRRLERWRLQKGLRFVANAVVISASVQIGMLPLMIVYFHRVSFAALLLNIFVGGLMAILVLAALGAIVISVMSTALAAPLKLIAEKSDWLMIHSVDPFSWLGIESIRMPHYRGWMTVVYVLYFLVLGFLVMALGRWKPLRLREPGKRKTLLARWSVAMAIAAFLVLVLTVVAHPFSSDRPDGKFHVDFLDVGQGDSALLTMPDGATLLIDGGGRPNIDWQKSNEVDDGDSFQRDARSVGERVVSEYLWARGLHHIDYVLATHADADHIDGLNDVVRNFKVRGAIVARTAAGDPEYRRFAETMKKMHVPVERIGAGDSMRFGGVTAQVLWPRANDDESAPSGNNDSIVLRFNFGDKFILFTGDVEREAELAMLAAEVDLRSDIVKVAHHGSKTSSVERFVAASQPDAAIISVGRSSIFGHPNKDVVERWRASGAHVMTTGEQGTISVVTDGRSIAYYAYVGGMR